MIRLTRVLIKLSAVTLDHLGKTNRLRAPDASSWTTALLGFGCTAANAVCNSGSQETKHIESAFCWASGRTGSDRQVNGFGAAPTLLMSEMSFPSRGMYTFWLFALILLWMVKRRTSRFPFSVNLMGTETR